MISRRRAQKNVPIVVFILTAVLIPSFAFGLSVPLSLVNSGTANQTSIFSADLAGVSGLTQVGSIRLVDDGTMTGGQGGIFSGFDVDAVFLDADGLLATTGDQTFASDFIFQSGTTRPTTNPIEQPNAAHPGPTFGSVNATTIDLATSTLNTFDAVSLASVDLASGFLTLGDGGSLIANFSSGIPVGSNLFLLTGDVGGQPGEALSAFVEVSDTPLVPPIIPPGVPPFTPLGPPPSPPPGPPLFMPQPGGTPIPEPTTFLLFGSGLLGIAAYRWMNSKKS